MQFQTVDRCLRWAYQIEARPVIAQPSAFSGRCEVRTPVPQAAAAVWDCVGQAAAVRAQVERLEPPLCWLAVACYSRTQARCDAAEALLEYLDPPANVREAYELLLAQYCGVARDSGSINRVRASLRCRKETALQARRVLFSELDRMRARLLDAVERHLVDAGLVRASGGNLVNLHRSISTMKSSTELVIATLHKLDATSFQKAGELLALLYATNLDAKGLCEAANALLAEVIHLAEVERPVEITELQRDHTGKATRAMKRTSKPQLEDVGAAMVGFLSAVISLAVEAEPRKRVAR